MKLCLPLGIHRSPRLLSGRTLASAADSQVCLFAGVGLFLSSKDSGSPHDSLHGSSEVILWKSHLLDTLTQFSGHHNLQLLKGKKPDSLKSPAIFSAFQFAQILCVSSFSKPAILFWDIPKFEFKFLNLNSDYWLRLGLTHWEEMIGNWNFLSFWAQEAGILTDIILMPRKIYIAIKNAIDWSKSSLLSKASIFP